MSKMTKEEFIQFVLDQEKKGMELIKTSQNITAFEISIGDEGYVGGVVAVSSKYMDHIFYYPVDQALEEVEAGVKVDDAETFNTYIQERINVSITIVEDQTNPDYPDTFEEELENWNFGEIPLSDALEDVLYNFIQ